MSHLPGQQSPPHRSSKGEILLGLADALTVLAARMQTRASAARDFTRLVLRAQQISIQARQLNTSKWQFVENSGALAADILKFADEVAAASARAKAELSGNTSIAEALGQHAQRVAQIARGGGAGDGGGMEVELKPLEATLTTLRERMQTESRVSEDADLLAVRARGLAAGASRLRDGGRAAGAAATEIHLALLGFVDEAVSISSRMSLVSTGLGEAATSMAVRTRALSGDRVMGGATPAIVWTGVQDGRRPGGVVGFGAAGSGNRA